MGFIQLLIYGKPSLLTAPPPHPDLIPLQKWRLYYMTSGELCFEKEGMVFDRLLAISHLASSEIVYVNGMEKPQRATSQIILLQTRPALEQDKCPYQQRHFTTLHEASCVAAVILL